MEDDILESVSSLCSQYLVLSNKEAWRLRIQANTGYQEVQESV